MYKPSKIILINILTLTMEDVHNIRVLHYNKPSDVRTTDVGSRVEVGQCTEGIRDMSVSWRGFVRSFSNRIAARNLQVKMLNHFTHSLWATMSVQNIKNHKLDQSDFTHGKFPQYGKKFRTGCSTVSLGWRA